MGPQLEIMQGWKNKRLSDVHQRLPFVPQNYQRCVISIGGVGSVESRCCSMAFLQQESLHRLCIHGVLGYFSVMEISKP